MTKKEVSKKTNNEPMRVLAVPAAGQFSGLVVPELVKRGVMVRGLVHKHADQEAALSLGATEVMIGDLGDPLTVKRALEGMDGVFYLAPAFLENEGEIGKKLVEAASEAGVRRFVFSSVIHPVLSALSNHAGKAPVEEALLDSEMEWVVLQPTMFFQNFAAAWEKTKESGSYAEPWSNDTRFTRVDYRDVAEVAAIAMTEDELLYGTFELCSEGNLNRHEVASLMSEVIGRQIQPSKAILPPSGGPPPQLTRMFDWYDKHSLLGNSLTLRAILGREPRTLRSYFEELNSK